MKNVTIKNTQICREKDKDFHKKWFSQKKEQSFITHVDTLYYMVSLKLENADGQPVPLKDFEPWQNFVGTLNAAKIQAEAIHESVEIFEDIAENLEVMPFKSARMYALHFGLHENFDFFVCSSTPNKDTPPIMVQIRSNALWIDGMKNVFDKSYECIESVLGKFGISIAKTQENRIDYAFHTNYINDLLHFFPEKDLGKMFVGNFERYNKQGNLHTHDDDRLGDRTVESDYFTLGRHTSNNVFFRVYNKTKEVIEVGKKQFFIEIWLKYGLISSFDEYVMRKAFVCGTYESIDKARCEFYCNYGTDKAIQREIAEKLADNSTPAKWFTKRAKQLVPAVTIITNVEIVTKRKFYDRKKVPLVNHFATPKRNIYNIFDQMSEIIRFLTSETLRFVKYKGVHAKISRINRPMADWWQRLRNAKKVEIVDKWEIEYLHFYQHNLDMELQEQATLKKMAKMGVYMEFAEGETSPRYSDDFKGSHIFHDFENFYGNLNDNDVFKYWQIKDKTHKEIRSKLRVNEKNALKLLNRPLPKLREKTPDRTFICAICGEVLHESQMAINITESEFGTCIDCARKSLCDV
jgi:hypothetical protein